MLLARGFTLLSQHWFTVLLAILSVVFFYVQAVQEERHCLAQYGEPLHAISGAYRASISSKVFGEIYKVNNDG